MLSFGFANFKKLRLFGALGATPAGAITVGVSIAILFAIIGSLVIPRLANAVLANVADHGG
jgi:ABC-type thiamin/hydroxymethylpyrimidine transport system permease subunit